MPSDDGNPSEHEILQALYKLGYRPNYRRPPSPEKPVLSERLSTGILGDPNNQWEKAARQMFQSSSGEKTWDPSKPKVKVMFGQFERFTGGAKDRTAVVCRYHADKIRNNPQVGFLDCLVSSTFNPKWHSVIERFEDLESNLSFPSYYEMKKKAKEQFVYWSKLVREPHFEECFFVEGVDELTLKPFGENFSLFKTIGSLACDPLTYQVNKDCTIFPSDSVKAKELLAAFGFLDFDILEEPIPRKNFTWACMTISSDENHHSVAYMQAFLDFVP